MNAQAAVESGGRGAEQPVYVKPPGLHCCCYWRQVFSGVAPAMSLYTLKYKETRRAADREILSVASIVSIMYVHTPRERGGHTYLFKAFRRFFAE